MGPRARSPLAAAAAGLAALLLAGTATATPPKAGLFVPGESLGGARIDMTKQEIAALWGPKHGVCRSCRRTTWYFNGKPFFPQGVGVSFRRGKAVALFTVWQPDGWRTPEGLALGDASPQVTIAYGALERRLCSGYAALVLPSRRAQSVFYLKDDELWGFGLTRPGLSPCP